MKKVIIILSGLFFTLAACQSESNSGRSNSESYGEEETLSGRELYEQNCMACHGVDGKLGVSGAKDLSQSKLDREKIINLILKGKNGMPPFEFILSDRGEVEAVADYVNTLKK